MFKYIQSITVFDGRDLIFTLGSTKQKPICQKDTHVMFCRYSMYFVKYTHIHIHTHKFTM